MKTVAFVPIKYNNERLPGKNIKKLSSGKPLISYILETLLNVNEIDEIYVYCSNPDIKNYLPVGVGFLERDKRLDLSETSFNEVLTSFAEIIDSDVYVLAHATAPLISVSSFTKGIQAVKSGKYDSALAVEKVQEFLWKEGKPFNYNPEAIPRTQDLDIIYKETCGMYVYNKSLIKDKKRRVGETPFLVEVSKVESCDINIEEDFILVDAIVNYMNLIKE